MEIKIEHQQAQAILNFLGAGIRMPEQLGKGDDAEKFDDIERSFLDEQIIKLRKLLISYSRRNGATKEILFGSSENWREIVVDPRSGRKASELVDPEAPFKVRLDNDEREGLYWALLLMAHPASPFTQALAVLDEVVWPIAQSIGADKQLAKHLKLDKRRRRPVLWNDDKEWERKDSKALKLVDEPEKKPEELPKKADA